MVAPRQPRAEEATMADVRRIKKVWKAKPTVEGAGVREGRMWGFQLWANLPARHKMMDPRYREVKRDDIPEATTAEGATVRVVCGEVAGVRGPVREIVTEPDYLDVSIPARSTFRHPVKAGHTVFAYVFDGEGYFDPERDPYAREDVGERYFDMERPCVCGNGTVVLYGPGDTVAVSTEERAGRTGAESRRAPRRRDGRPPASARVDHRAHWGLGVRSERRSERCEGAGA